MTREQYDAIWDDSQEVRNLLDSLITESPEIFPSSIKQGYQLSGHLPESKKMPGIRLRQIHLRSGVYSLRPSFVMSYMTGDVKELESALFLLSVNTQALGGNPCLWP